ncbi:MAG: 2Fe-2S iron-sulfur cluster binding domain-containing protein [Corynebacterium sp.]|nr:2Fe-2S iron-sulfur cluster binding domain-containing protein [Corynebacterium sp.]
MNKVTVDGADFEFSWPEERRLLHAMLDAGVPAPYGCEEGECGACMCRLEGGEREMVNNHVLDEQDIADNLTLACQTLRRAEDGGYTVTYLY